MEWNRSKRELFIKLEVAQSIKMPGVAALTFVSQEEIIV